LHRHNQLGLIFGCLANEPPLQPSLHSYRFGGHLYTRIEVLVSEIGQRLAKVGYGTSQVLETRKEVIGKGVGEQGADDANSWYRHIASSPSCSDPNRIFAGANERHQMLPESEASIGMIVRQEVRESGPQERYRQALCGSTQPKSPIPLPGLRPITEPADIKASTVTADGHIRCHPVSPDLSFSLALLYVLRYAVGCAI